MSAQKENRRERFAPYNFIGKPEPIIEQSQAEEEEEEELLASASVSENTSEKIPVKTSQPVELILPMITENDIDPREIHPKLPKTQIYNEILKSSRRKTKAQNKKLKLGVRKIKEPDFRRQKLGKIVPRIYPVIIKKDDDVPNEDHEQKTEPQTEPEHEIQTEPESQTNTNEEVEKEEVVIEQNFKHAMECVMNRVGDKSIRKQILKSMLADKESHFVLLLSEPMRTFEGVYKLVDDKLYRLWGCTAEVIDNVVHCWTYNTSTKGFSPQQSKRFNGLTDAVSIIL